MIRIRTDKDYFKYDKYVEKWRSYSFKKSLKCDSKRKKEIRYRVAQQTFDNCNQVFVGAEKKPEEWYFENREKEIRDHISLNEHYKIQNFLIKKGQKVLKNIDHVYFTSKKAESLGDMQSRKFFVKGTDEYFKLSTSLTSKDHKNYIEIIYLSKQDIEEESWKKQGKNYNPKVWTFSSLYELQNCMYDIVEEWLKFRYGIKVFEKVDFEEHTRQLINALKDLKIDKKELKDE